MNRKREKEEHLERLYYMQEQGKDSLDICKKAMSGNYNAEIIDELSSEGLLELSEANNKITLTDTGQEYARKLIRAHRLAERLIYDVLGVEFETGACEFEHTVTHELVDSICILLGHPRECPHGMPIPEGECCRQSLKTAQSSVAPLTELKIGQSARVAYINCKDDQQLHKIDSLHIRPGAVVKLHQSYPTYVIECENGNIALDKEVASNICIWKEPQNFQPVARESVALSGQGGRGFRFRHGRRGNSNEKMT